MKKRSRNKTRSILSLILSLALVLGMCTASYAAEEIPDGEPGEEAVVETDTTAEDTLEEGIPAEETQTEDTEGSEYITEDFAGETEEYPADEISGYDEYDGETLSADETEDIEEEEPEIQVFAATEGDQTLKVVQKAEGTIGDDVSFTYHLYKITDAAETIENMGDIISYEPGASLEYVIVDTGTGEEVSTETTDGNGAFAIHVGETAEFTLEAETDWFVNQDTPDAYPLVSVGSDGEYADVVGGTNGVVYYGQIEPEPVQPVISDVSVTSSLTDNEKTYDGGSVILTAGATVTPDTATVSYQWYKDGVEISGATGSTLTLDGNVSDTGTYKCVVSAENDELTATAEAEVTVTINKASQNISYAVTEMEKALGDESFTNVLTQTTVDGQITYASSDESVATVNAETGEVTILALGEVTITATAAATENYEEATASYTITVVAESVAPVISDVSVTSSLTDNEKTYDGGSVTLTAGATVTPDTATVSYQWYKDGVEISGATGSTLTLDGNVSDTGTYKCVVTAENDDLTAAAEAEVTITINKADQDISYEESTVTKVDYDEPFIIDLTKTTVYGSISYTSSDESVATIDPESGEVHIVGTGYTTITATAAETDNYKEATASYVLTVNEDVVEWEIDVNNQQVTWDEENEEWVDDLSYTGDPLELEMKITLTEEEEEELEGIAYQWYRYNAETQDFDEIEGATEKAYTLEGEDVNAGDYIYMCMAVVTYKSGYAHKVYSPIEVIIEKAQQSIVFEEDSLTAVVGDTVTNKITEDSVIVGTVTYESDDDSVATVDEETGAVTIVGAGTVTIIATASETENYEETFASYTITVLEQPVINGLTITSNLTDNEKTYDGDEVTLTANTEYIPDTAEITYQWYKKNDTGEYTEIEGADEETLTLDGNVSDTGTYKCEVTVTNDGLTTSEEAEITITINKAEQDISYEESTVTKVDYDEPFIIDLTKTTVYGSISYTSSDESVATVDPDTGEVTIVGTGYTTITATAAETDNYKEATASYVLTVNEDVVEWEIDVNNQQVTWDEDSGEWVDDLTYTGESLELEMAITLTEEEQEELVGITYQWYRYNAETLGFDKIEGATEDAYTLEDEDVNAGDYIYMCVAVVTYKNNIDHTVYGPIEVIIEKADQSIVFEEESLEAVAGDTVTNEIMKEDSVIYGDVTYTSSDESIATVDEETGEVTIVGVGTVTITATAAETENYNAVSAEYTITTSDEVSVTVTSDMDDEDNTKTYDGKEVTLTAKASSKVDGVTYTYQWYTVDESGTETEIEDATEDALTLDGNAADSGTYKCTVTVNYPNDAEPATVSDIIEITINKAPQDISYEETEIEKTTADGAFTNPLTETFISPEEGAGITYSSSDETVATVNAETGEVTIEGIGEATITATAAETANYAEATASYILTVLEQPVINGLTITTSGLLDDNTKTYDGDGVALTAVADYTPDTATITYQWYKKNDAGEYTEIEGADEETLTLDGNVSDTGTYKCEVTVTNDGLTTSDHAEITITINVAEQDISYEETEIEKTTADGAFTNPLTETFVSPEEGAGITYTSSDETVATVNADTGEVTIVGIGEATITAKAAETANYAEATASYMITISKGAVVNYAVKLWGICTDTYSYDEGETTSVASLTFGPATGADHLNSYVECSSDTCIHKLSWDEIIAYCNQYQGDSAMLTNLFGSCLENGCTKAVELTPNETLFNMTAVNNAQEQGYTGDGVSTLYYLLNYDSSPAYACRWNYSYTEFSSSDPANIYSRSRIRATLTGDSADAREWVANSHNDYYGVNTLCDESNCLLSCFPANLQAAVVPRTTLNTGNATSGTSANDKTTYDKLFLFSFKETGITFSYDDGGGSDYGVNSSNSARVAYEFSGTSATTSSSHYWWSRSRNSGGNDSACRVNTSGNGYGSIVYLIGGLSPGFCIK